MRSGQDAEGERTAEVDGERSERQLVARARLKSVRSTTKRRIAPTAPSAATPHQTGERHRQPRPPYEHRRGEDGGEAADEARSEGSPPRGRCSAGWSEAQHLEVRASRTWSARRRSRCRGAGGAASRAATAPGGGSRRGRGGTPRRRSPRTSPRARRLRGRALRRQGPPARARRASRRLRSPRRARGWPVGSRARRYRRRKARVYAPDGREEPGVARSVSSAAGTGRARRSGMA